MNSASKLSAEISAVIFAWEPTEVTLSLTATEIVTSNKFQLIRTKHNVANALSDAVFFSGNSVGYTPALL